MVLPNAMILGAPKSGSTWLYDNLKGHPQIATPRKEIHYFNNNLHEGIEWYQNLFAEVHTDEPIILDAGSTYIYVYDHLGAYFDQWRDLPTLIHETLGTPKMIMIFRDPVDRLWSNYINLLQGVLRYGTIYSGEPRHFSPEDVNQANYPFNAPWIGSYEKQILNFFAPDTIQKTILTHPTLLERGFYDIHVSRYLEVFPRESFLFLELGMIKNDPTSVIHQICDFLGIERWTDPEIINQKSNDAATRQLPYNWRLQALLLRYQDNSVLKPIIKRLMARNLAMGSKQTLDSNLSELLSHWYRPHTLRLQSLTGLDLSHWK